nr:hypothetical protein [uncultured Duganella sp.]
MPSLEQQDLTESTGLTRPHPCTEGILSVGTEYFRLDRASEILRCAAADLLHLGAVGKAEIMAPVVCPGVFKWPQGSAGIPFPEISGPLPVSFNQADRIILSASDLSKIEAVGWAIPQFFYAPTAARRLIDLHSLFVTNVPEKELIDGVEVFRSTVFQFSEEEQFLREAGFNSLWVPKGVDNFIRNGDGDFEDASDYVAPEYSSERITKIEHLFLSKSELQRLIDGLPQDEMAVERSRNDIKSINVENIGHLNRHAFNREFLWKVAIYCLGKMGNSKVDIDNLIANVDIEFQRLFPDAKPLSAKHQRSHLTRTLNGDMSHPK